MAMRLTRWIALVVGLVAAGAVAGRLFGGVMAGLSPDYPTVASDYVTLGLKLGLVAGTVLGACHGVGERRPPSLGRTARAVALLGGVAVVCPGLIFALLSIDAIRELYASRVLEIRLDLLANPGRYVLYRGLHQAVIAGTLTGSVAGGVYLWRGRHGATGSSPGS